MDREQLCKGIKLLLKVVYTEWERQVPTFVSKEVSSGWVWGVCRNQMWKVLQRDEASGEAGNFGSDSKESACNAGDPGSIPGLRRSPGEGNGNPLQYPCLENPMDRRAWWATVHGVAKRHNWVTNGFNFWVDEWHHFLEYQLSSSMQDSLASQKIMGCEKWLTLIPMKEDKRRKQMLLCTSSGFWRFQEWEWLVNVEEKWWIKLKGL